MENIYLLIEKKLEERGILKKKFLESLEMSYTGYNQMIENNTMKLSTLYRICDILNEPISTFFQNTSEVNEQSLGYQSNIYKRISSLENRITIIEQNQILINQRVIEK